MVLALVWLCPIVTAFYSILCLLTCFSLSAYYHGMPSSLPFLSEIANKPPANGFYCMMTNHIAVLAAIWMYLKHREIVSYFSCNSHQSFHKRASFLNLCIGLLGVFCLQISVNFARRYHSYIPISSNMVLMVCSLIYVWVHTLLSTFIVDANLARLKLFMVRSVLAAIISSCYGSILKVFAIRDISFYTTSSPLDHATAGAVYEWIAYFSMCFFLLTDAYEFRGITYRAPKLVIPGAPLYNAERLTPTTETRELTPAMSPFTVPLIR
ncbi:hypothetical protein Y032_0005g2450 [Ancylostoma ceylanicum]|uniref:CWH43-like N-terminal domain-containing protein n=1 Tax=Ancylostoma ceylanicum TaxID=53326 RepID=A0A016VRC4_9BILA|nr:hypothetical protein Y032_0005g2450 [Ancylostoma ceylanicum]